MLHLHRINDKLAEASQKNKMNSSANAGTGTAVPAEPAAVPSPAAPVPAPAAAPAASQEAILSQALLRRYEEMLKLKRDLTGRFTSFQEQVCNAKEQTENLTKKRTAFLSELDEYLVQLEQTDTAFDPADQGRLALECRKLEQIRLAAVRLDLRMHAEKLTQLDIQNPLAGKKENVSFMHELHSLTFSQLANFGFALFFPLLCTLLLAALLISAAVILSMSGAFT